MSDRTAAVAIPTFSYAQAAKGRPATHPAPHANQQAAAASTVFQSSNDREGSVSSRAPSAAASLNGSTAASSIDQKVVTTSAASHPADMANGIPKTGLTSLSKAALTSNQHKTPTSNATEVSSPSSPSFGTASTSTLPLGDDFASTPNTSTESTWDKQSQSSNTGDKSSESTVMDNDHGKVLDEPKPEAAEKPNYVVAPIPSVNIWTQRKEQMAQAMKDTPASSTPANAVLTQTSAAQNLGSTVESDKADQRKKSYGEIEKKENISPIQERRKTSARDDTRPREDARKVSGRKSNEKSASAAPPSLNDSTAWPTPDTAIESNSAKHEKPAEAQPKGLAIQTKATGSKKWVPVPITHSNVYGPPQHSRKPGARSERGPRDGQRRNPNYNSQRENGDAETGKARSEMPAQREFGREKGSAKRSSSTGPPQNRKNSDRPRQDAEAKDSDRKSSQSKAPHRQFDLPNLDVNALPGNGANGSAHFKGETPTQPRSASEGQRPYTRGHYREGSMSSTREGSNRSGDRSRSNYSRRGSQFSGNGFSPNTTHFNGHVNGQMPMSAFPHGQPFYSPQMFSGQFSPQQQRNFRGSQRGQTVPNTPVMYNNNFRPMGFPPLQTQMPQMFDPQNQIMSAFNMNGFDGFPSVPAAVQTQLEYYFSIENLCKDIFLRKNMDSEGFVLLSTLASFKRLQGLTKEIEIIRQAAYNSPSIELRSFADGKDRIRRVYDWEQWVLPIEQRVLEAQNEVPNSFPPGFNHAVNQKPAVSPEPMPEDLGSALHGEANTFVPKPTQVPDESEDSKLSAKTPDFQPAPSEALGNETFTDEQVENQLFVATRKIDGRNSFPSRVAMPYIPDPPRGRPGAPSPPATGATSADSDRLLRSARDQPSPSPFYWVRSDPQAIIPLISKDLIHETYLDFRKVALENRSRAGPGETHLDMVSLYQFWSHFLPDNFNKRMYDEFKRIAVEDHSENGSSTGMEYLWRFHTAVGSRQRLLARAAPPMQPFIAAPPMFRVI